MTFPCATINTGITGTLPIGLFIIPHAQTSGNFTSLVSTTVYDDNLNLYFTKYTTILYYPDKLLDILLVIYYNY